MGFSSAPAISPGKTALDQFVQNKRYVAVRWAEKYFVNPDTVEDAVQTAFVKAYQAIDTYDVHRSLEIWLHVIVRNVCFDILRHRQYEQRTLPCAPLENPKVLARREFLDVENWHQENYAADPQEQIAEALAALRPRQRELVQALFIDDVPRPELERELGISANALRRRILAARTRMRQARSTACCAGAA